MGGRVEEGRGVKPFSLSSSIFTMSVLQSIGTPQRTAAQKHTGTHTAAQCIVNKPGRVKRVPLTSDTRTNILCYMKDEGRRWSSKHGGLIGKTTTKLTFHAKDQDSTEVLLNLFRLVDSKKRSFLTSCVFRKMRTVLRSYSKIRTTLMSIN